MSGEGVNGCCAKIPTYIGTKLVNATPMSKEEFEYREKGGIELDRSKATFGYLVIYEDGYRSWSPKEVFERCYRLVSPKEAKLLFI